MHTTPHAPTLAELQRTLARHIHHGHVDDDLAWMAAPANGSERRSRLAVYTDGFPARLIEALREAYPAVAHLTGAPTFARLVERYRSGLEARRCNLNFVGDGLPAFLRDDELSSRLPFLADLAALERAVQHVFHATPLPPLEPANLADWSADDWEHATLQFQTTVDCVISPWPLIELWETRHRERGDIDLEIEHRDAAVFVYRMGFDVHAEAIDRQEGEAWSRLRGGASLGEVVLRCTEEGRLDAPLGDWLGQWMQRGWLVGCTRNGDGVR